MSNSVALMAWLVAGVCFILSLSGLSRHETSRRGNLLGIIGMAIAILATLFSGLIGYIPDVSHSIESATETAMLSEGVDGFGIFLLIAALAVGGGIGVYLANRVAMTEMPQLVAILHSFVGLAATLVGLSNHFIHWNSVEGMDTIHKVEVFLGVLIGGYTFAGSVIAFGKLDGRIGSSPLILPNRHWINLGMAAFSLLLLIWYIFAGTGWGTMPLILVTIVACVLGWHMVMAIGGADMPVVVSMLNSYSGWAAAAIGFLIPNDLLIVTGALVGSSGAILSYIMCAAMNRSFVSVILGGFGQGAPAASSSALAAADSGEEMTYHTTSAEETASWLLESEEVVVIPGYGMAVAQAHNTAFARCAKP